MRFRHDALYKMFHGLTLDEKIEFLTLDLSERPKHYWQVEMDLLYASAQPVAVAKYKEMADSLLHISPIYRSYLKNLKQNDTSKDSITLNQLMTMIRFKA